MEQTHYFTLQAFEPVCPENVWELRQLTEIRFAAGTAQEGKHRLSDMIAEQSIFPKRFYRFEGSGCFGEVRPDFRFNISFYLFEDGRLCPLRIWNRAEGGSFHPGDPEWTAHFDGIPPWSLVASIEPRWHLVQLVPASFSWMGTSKRDWQKRNCWSLMPVHSPHYRDLRTPNHAPAIFTQG
ncbi:MAG: hypothetical protein JO028_11455 [Acidobacteriaceae bacterium]|nr:hypothetical protein [Acidobacteriaceae bacterium]MBV9225810.1 hypothetical protein [Acidobacteriaceae bacterium]